MVPEGSPQQLSPDKKPWVFVFNDTRMVKQCKEMRKRESSAETFEADSEHELSSPLRSRDGSGWDSIFLGGPKF